MITILQVFKVLESALINAQMIFASVLGFW